MKKFYKVFLVAIAVLFSTATYAQDLKFGVNAGMNLSNMSGDYDNTKANIGFQVGVTVDYFLTPEIFLQSGLSFTTKGVKFDDLPGISDPKIGESYLQLPIRVGYSIPVSDGFNINFNVGPYLAYGVGGKTKMNILGVSGEGDTFGDNGAHERFDFGVGAGVGADFGPIAVNIGYEYGITNASKIDNVSVHNNNAFLTLGYKF